MRTKQLINGLNNSRKIFLNVDGVAFYTTVGDTDKLAYRAQRIAVQEALMRVAYEKIQGFSTTFRNYDEKGQMTKVEVSVSLL